MKASDNFKIQWIPAAVHGILAKGTSGCEVLHGDEF